YAGGLQRLLDAKLGLVVRQGDSVDTDDRDVHDMADAGSPHRGREVAHRGDVLVAGRLCRAVDDHVRTVDRGVHPATREQVAAQPAHRRAVVPIASAQGAYAMSGRE